MSAQHFIREVARMLDGGKMPEWAILPRDERELTLLMSGLNPEPRQPSADTPYGRYLQSPEWKWRRSIVMVLGRGRCACCGAVADQVHHLSYARKGRELLRDLLPVCGPCHDGKHVGGSVYHKAVEDITRRRVNTERKWA